MKYKIDYGYDIADLYTPVEQEKVIGRFYHLANQCFGIRKSITKDPKVLSISDVEIPSPYYKLKGAYEMLEHSKPLSDVIVWDKDGNKIKSEWDD